jgi:serine/threonine protein kinase
MGEVYRARDTRLDRSVAIKILPAQFSTDPARKQRFEREAKTISTLNHPNICALYDVGTQEGIEYLVMECIEGETLAKRLEKGALATEQVLKVGTEIAAGLDTAHRSGVVHRDLKPGNIMLTKTGAKLLDFGLAKPTISTESAVTLTNTVGSSPITQEGSIVGTFQYMSPEQVEGKELDGRSDIFSLGAVLYEMLTGQRAFEGKSQLSVASAILEKEPTAITAIKPLTPRSIDHIVRRCLAKDLDDRWQSARDLALELKSISTEPSTHSGVALPITHSKFPRQLMGWALAALTILAGAIYVARVRTDTSLHPETIKASIQFSEQIELDPTGPVAISPDGKLMVFLGSKAGSVSQLWLRRFDVLTQTALPSTEDAQNPFWSPDSRWIAFASEGKLKKISINGGSPLEVCEAGANRGGSWGSSGTILFVPGLGAPVYAVSANGGTPIAVTQLDQSLHEFTHRWPQLLPDGKHFLFFSRGSENRTYLGRLGSTERKLILTNDTNAFYASPGFLLFVRRGTLMAQPFDLKRFELSGTPVTIAEHTATYGLWQHALFSVSDSGMLTYLTRREHPTQPAWVDRAGNTLESLDAPAEFTEAAISPDGQKIAFVINDPNDDTTNIWSLDVSRHLRSRLTFEPLVAYFPVWAPDGNRVLFASNRLGQANTFSIPANGMGQAELFLASDSGNLPTSWSSDGRFVAFTRSPNVNMERFTVWIYPTFGDKKAYPLLPANQARQWGAVFSPDGKWLAFQADESGISEVYIVPFPETNSRIQVSKDGGWNPRWSRDGKELLYFSSNGNLTVASLRPAQNGIQIGSTRPLFKTNTSDFQISLDGKRILIFKDVGSVKPSAINLITNWTNALPK